jgi:hypothetical protein
MKGLQLFQLFIYLTIFAPVLGFSQTEVQGKLMATLDPNGRQILKQSYLSFLKNEFLTSEYCKEGWGDGDAAEKMQKACQEAHDKIVAMTQDETLPQWMNLFHFEFAKVNQESISYHFEQDVELKKGASLSCSISLEFQAGQDKKIITKPFFDLYCDH